MIFSFEKLGQYRFVQVLIYIIIIEGIGVSRGKKLF